MNLWKIWNDISNIGVKYEADYISIQNTRLLNQFLLILFFVFVEHGIYDMAVLHNIFSSCILLGFSLFLLILLILPVLIKQRRSSLLLCFVFIIIVFIIFLYESYWGMNAGAYLYFYSLIIAIPFVFNFRTDKIYIITILLCVVAAIIINGITNYSLFSDDFYLLYPGKQEQVAYLSMFDNFVVVCLSVVFIVRKLQYIHELYAEKQIADLERKNIQQKMEMKNLEILNAKQELLITNLRIAQKNELLEKTKELDSKQINKLIRQEKNKDKNFDDMAQMYLDISPEFYRFLNEKADTNKLSKLDLKYCAYIYTKKSNKDIAEILGVNYSSVKSHKRHLKRKLNLTSDENLDFFIQNIALSTT